MPILPWRRKNTNTVKINTTHHRILSVPPEVTKVLSRTQISVESNRTLTLLRQRLKGEADIKLCELIKSGVEPNQAIRTLDKKY